MCASIFEACAPPLHPHSSPISYRDKPNTWVLDTTTLTINGRLCVQVPFTRSVRLALAVPDLSSVLCATPCHTRYESHLFCLICARVSAIAVCTRVEGTEHTSHCDHHPPRRELSHPDSPGAAPRVCSSKLSTHQPCEAELQRLTLALSGYHPILPSPPDVQRNATIVL